jgi:hypothetical protein
VSFVANLMTDLTGALAIVVGWLFLRHLHHAPQATHEWTRRAVIMMMYAGGAALTVTALGGWADQAVNWLAGLLGGSLYAGPFRLPIIGACLILGAALIVGLIWEPDDKMAYAAIGMPLLLSLVPGGLIHSAYLAVNTPALDFAQWLNHAVGG